MFAPCSWPLETICLHDLPNDSIEECSLLNTELRIWVLLAPFLGLRLRLTIRWKIIHTHSSCIETAPIPGPHVPLYRKLAYGSTPHTETQPHVIRDSSGTLIPMVASLNERCAGAAGWSAFRPHLPISLRVFRKMERVFWVWGLVGQSHTGLVSEKISKKKKILKTQIKTRILSWVWLRHTMTEPYHPTRVSEIRSGK